MQLYMTKVPSENPTKLTVQFGKSSLFDKNYPSHFPV